MTGTNASAGADARLLKDEFKLIPKSDSKDFISKIISKDSPSRLRENSNSRSVSGNARRQLVAPNQK